MTRLWQVCLAVALTLAMLGGGHGQGHTVLSRLSDLADNVSIKSEVGFDIRILMLPMRDGVKLWTMFWDLHKGEEKYPTVIIRSPYGPEGTENLAALFLPFGFVPVVQNQRGTGKSEGNFTFWGTAATDEADTISWIREQSWSNGQVFVMGASADGINSYLAMNLHQNESAQWIIFASSYGYEFVFQNGALRYHLVEDWLKHMQAYRPDAPSYFDVALAHEEPHTAWWQKRMVSDFHTVTFPGVHWGGWFDIFLQPMIHTWEGYNYASDAVGQHKLIIGPRGHCLITDPLLYPDDRFADLWSYLYALKLFRSIANNTATHEVDDPVLNEALQGIDQLKTMTLYIMGPTRWPRPPNNTVSDDPFTHNVTGLYWTTLPFFPAYDPQIFYLHKAGRLLGVMPIEDEASQSFVYDPAHPVPTLGGNNLELPCGPEDQRSVESRSDVLVFTTEPFEQDTAVVGRITVRLWVSSNATDTDFTVKVTDVYSEEYLDRASMLVSDDIIRMRWRNTSATEPQLITPGELYQVEIKMWNIAYVFNKGHSLRLAVSSSNYPRFSANLNNGRLIRDGGPSIVANNTVHMEYSHPSYIELPVVSMNDIPKNIDPTPFRKVLQRGN